MPAKRGNPAKTLTRPIIQVQDLSMRFGEVSVLDHINFAVREGEFAVIIGPNGAGKTVLLKSILGLLIPTSGTIQLHVSPNDVGYVPQRLQFDPSFPLTVRELMLLKLEDAGFWLNRKQAEDRIVHLLDMTKSTRVIDRQIGKLSGGELQRVLLAYALVTRPRLLCLDEPAAGVDVVGEQTFYDLIDVIRHVAFPWDKVSTPQDNHADHMQEHVTIVMVSHDLDVVYKYADTVLCVNKQLLCSGLPTTVLTTEVLAKVYGRHADLFHHSHQHQERKHP